MSQYLSHVRFEEPISLEPSDISFLQTQITKKLTEVESIDTQMNELKRVYEAQISEMIRQKTAKLVEIASCRNILSPVRRVPLEILSEIFELACFPKNGAFNALFDIIPKAHTLSSVCVAWRKAAHATPRLWSRICVGLCVVGYRAFGTGVEWIQDWITRSRGLPLEIHVILNGINLDREHQFLEKLLNSRHRIRSLDLSGDIQSYLPLLRLPCSSFPRLETVCLSFRHDDFMDFHSFKAFLDTPNLHHVKLTDATHPMVEIPAQQLTSLIVNLPTTNEGSVHDCLMILRMCGSLVNLDIDLSGEDRGYYDDLSITLPALKLLKIACRAASPGRVDLLRGLTVPLLEHLSLSWCRQDTPKIVADVADLQFRCNISLSSLTLKCFQGVPDIQLFTNNLIVIIRTFPEIESLRIQYADFDFNPLLRALTHGSQDHQILVPRLTEFQLYNPYRYLDDYPSNLTSMVLSRSTSHDGFALLQRVKPDGYHYHEDIARLSKLPGLNFEYTKRISN